MVSSPSDATRRERLLNAEWPAVIVAVLTAAVVFAAGIVLDVLLRVQNREILYSDVFTSGVAGVLAYIAGRYYARTRRAAAERLQASAEVNHHVRNALTAVLYSVHARRDAALVEVTQQAVGRIDWVLREVLGESDRNPTLKSSDPRVEKRRPA